MSEFPVYQPSSGHTPPELAADPDPGDRSDDADPPSWYVVVEFSNGGQAKPPTVIEYATSNSYGDYAQACAAAREAAFEFEPPDPYSPRARRVFRMSEREYLTVIDGAMSTFHFSTRVGEYLGEV